MNRTVALLAALGVAAVAVGAAVPVAADHGSPSNYTVIPHERQPGNDDATYEQHATSPISFDRLDYIRATWKEGGFTGCGPSDSKVFGIDREDDEPGTTVDHGLAQHVEESKIGEDVFYADFYEKNDTIGSSTFLNEGDEFVALTKDCFDNPGQPGWYQIQSTIGGTAANGTYVEASDVSHYFYVCECDSRAEAREKLGPPPSADESTPTRTATAAGAPTRTPADEGTPLPSRTPTTDRATTAASSTTAAADGSAAERDDGSATAASSDRGRHDGGSGDGGNGGSGDGGSGNSGSGDAADGDASGDAPTSSAGWSKYARKTPTVGSGPGFGPALALAALGVAALLAVRA